MGNCIGKKSRVKTKRQRHSSLTIVTAHKLYSNDQTRDDVKESINHDKVIQYSSPPSTVNEPLIITPTLSILSPVQNENNLVLTTNEEDIIMGHLFSTPKEINNDQQVVIATEEITQESLDISPSSSLSDSSLSSFSYNTTSFSSQDHLILPSSSSSSISSIDLISLPSLLNKYHLVTYTEQFFSTVIPVSSSRYHKDIFFNKFHQNILSHDCQILSAVIDDIVQQQRIRIHRRSRNILIEHKQLECINLKDIKLADTPSLIFDEEEKVVYVTKYARLSDLQSITYTTNLSGTFSSCDYCSVLLSGSKLNDRLRSFILVNTTHHLVEIFFNKMNHFGYISQIYSNQIRQTIINNSKLSYSYDLDVDYTNFYFVLRVQSWPQEIRSTYEQRERLWPLNIENLFNNTCFIRTEENKHEGSVLNKCHACEKILSSSSSDSSWSYTYTMIEAQLVRTMSDGQIRFTSIVWNYLNGRTQGQLPFVIFKHTLFYFFEQYTSDSFTTSDLLSHVQLFTDFLLHRLQIQSVPHYFNSNYNLYNDKIPTILISIKMTYLDLKTFSIYLLPKSSLYLYHLVYLIQFQTNILQSLLSSKTNSIQTIVDTHQLVIKQLSSGIKTYKRQLDSTIAMKSHRPLTLDCLYRYQEENVQIILDYLPLLRDKEPSLLIHSLWSMFIQYFNCLFEDLFIS